MPWFLFRRLLWPDIRQKNGFAVQASEVLYDVVEEAVSNLCGQDIMRAVNGMGPQYAVRPVVLENCDAKLPSSFRKATIGFDSKKSGPVIHAAELFARALKKIATRSINSANCISTMQCFADFLENKERHLNSLTCPNVDIDSETPIRDVFGEHLLSQLVPGKHYLVNSNKTGECPCGCGKKIPGRTFSIGNAEVWHGDPDIVITRPSVPVHTERPYDVLDDDDEPDDEEMTDDCNKKDKICSDIKKVKEKLDSQDVFSQVIAQTIVHSFVVAYEKNVMNVFIPSISTNFDKVDIFFYDSTNDILLKTDEPLSVFEDPSRTSFNLDTITYLWMCLNYFQFGPYLSQRKIEMLKRVDRQSNFHLLVGEKLPVYKNYTRFQVGRIRASPTSLQTVDTEVTTEPVFLLDEHQVDPWEYLKQKGKY